MAVCGWLANLIRVYWRGEWQQLQLSGEDYPASVASAASPASPIPPSLLLSPNAESSWDMENDVATAA